MMIPHPVLLGLFWLASIFCSVWSQSNNHETHQVYSYTYHFQHNGTTDPKKFIQSVLSDPPNGQGAVVKTFWNPNVRGFISQGYFPARSPSFKLNSHPKLPTFQGIKKVVEENLKQVSNPTPPELIKVPPHVENTIRNIDEEVNRRFNHLNNRLDTLDPGVRAVHGGIPGGGIPNPVHQPIPPQPVVNNHINNNVVTNVKTFEKNLPNGKVFEKIETYSYNPAPVSNNVGNQPVFHQNQRAFGRTVSYFRKEHRNGGSPVNDIIADFPVNDDRNQHQNVFRGNVENRGLNINNNFHNKNNNADRLLRNINDIANNLHSGFGQRLNGFQNDNNLGRNQPNHYFIQGQNNPNRFHGNHNSVNQNTHNNENNHNPGNQNLAHNRNNFHNQVNNNVNNNRFIHKQAHQNVNHNNNNNNNHHFHNGILQNLERNLPNSNEFGVGHGNGDNTANQVFNTLDKFARNNNPNHDAPRPEHNEGHRENDNTFRWDDDNRGWQVHQPTDWSRRNNFGHNNQPFSNNIANHGPSIRHHNNPVAALKATLESLSGRPLQLPNFNDNGGENGNFNNFRGGGEERTYRVDRVAEGPNSYNRNQIRRYDRNFAVNSNSGYQYNRQWSTGDLSKLDTRHSKGPTFKKDYIDVFDDED